MKIIIQKYSKNNIFIRRADPNAQPLGHVYFLNPNNLTYSLWNYNEGYQDVVPRSKFIKDVLHPERRNQ